MHVAGPACVQWQCDHGASLAHLGAASSLTRFLPSTPQALASTSSSAMATTTLEPRGALAQARLVGRIAVAVSPAAAWHQLL